MVRTCAIYFFMSLILNLFLLLHICFTSQLFSADFTLNTYEYRANNSFLRKGAQLLCPNLFNQNYKNTNDYLRIQRVANHMRIGDQRDDGRRGMLFREEDFEYAKHIFDEIFYRILNDWRTNKNYSNEDALRLLQDHQSLDPRRLKFITVEQMTLNGEPSSYFSGIRIYDSSKNYRIKNILQNYKDSKSMPELVFPNFDLKSTLTKAGIRALDNHWTLGLIDIETNYKDALKTLVAQVAYNLDANYNHNDYFLTRSTQSIEKDDLNILIYTNHRIRAYYKRALKIDPLKDENGNEIILKKNGKEYYLFHMYGSEFIRKYFQIAFMEPSFSTNKDVSKIIQKLEFLRQEVHRQLLIKTNKKLIVNDINDFVGYLHEILMNAMRTNELPLLEMHQLMKSLPEDIFDLNKNLYLNEISKMKINQILQITGSIPKHSSITNIREATILSLMTALNIFIIEDPGLTILNNMDMK